MATEIDWEQPATLSGFASGDAWGGDIATGTLRSVMLRVPEFEANGYRISVIWTDGPSYAGGEIKELQSKLLQ